MRNQFVAIVLIAASAPGNAADFHGVTFGDDCASVPAREMALGSNRIPWTQPPGADIYAFEVHEDDFDLVMTYFCPKGKLLTVNYSFPAEKLQDAVKTYRHALIWLNSMFGAPDHENSGMENPHLQIIESDPQKYFAHYRSGPLGAEMIIHHTLEPQGDAWRVKVVVHEARQ
jgi:hypothetical protein